jgi:hypothetical protein
MFHNVLRGACPELLPKGYFALVKALKTLIFFIFFLLKSFFKNVMEYALPETTIGVKWKCVWNGKLFLN